MKILSILLPAILVVAAIGIAQDAEQDQEARIESLVKNLGSSTWREREEAEKELREIGEPALEKLRDAVESDDPERSLRAGRIVEKIETALKVRNISDLSSEVLKKLGLDESILPIEREVFRQMAEGAIGTRESENAPVVKPREVAKKFQELAAKKATKIGDAWVYGERDVIASSLYRFRNSYNEALNLTLIIAASKVGTSSLEKARLLYQLQKPSNEEVLRRLLEYTKSENTVLRLTAMQKLGESAAKEYQPYFTKWFEEEQPYARQFAVQAMRRLSLEGEVPDVFKKGLLDKDCFVRYSATGAVADMGGKETAGLLLPMLDDVCTPVRAAAIAGLAKAPLDQVKKPLRAMLKDKEQRVVVAAITALGNLGDLEAVDEIAGMMDSSNGAVKMESIAAVAKLAFEKYMDKLVELCTSLPQVWHIAQVVRDSGHALAFNTLDMILEKVKKEQANEHYMTRVLQFMLDVDEEKGRKKLIGIFKDEEVKSSFKWQLLRIIKSKPDKTTIEMLIDQLDSQDLTLRTQSLETLRFLTARKIESYSRRTLPADQQGKKEKEEWLKWWNENKEEFTFEKAAGIRGEELKKIIEKADKSLKEGNYQEALNLGYSARRLESGNSGVEKLIHKASFLQSVKREMDMRGNRKR